MLPGIAANTTPVLVKPYFKILAKAVDGGRVWRNKPILGSHKTWRGFIFGTLASIFITWIQTSLYEQYEFFENLSLIPYGSKNFLLVGFVMGFGALFGDSVKSFFKRRLNIAPGAFFFPWDQLDAVFGALVLLPIVYVPSLKLIFALVVLALILHILTRRIGYWIGVNKEKW